MVLEWPDRQQRIADCLELIASSRKLIDSLEASVAKHPLLADEINEAIEAEQATINRYSKEIAEL